MGAHIVCIYVAYTERLYICDLDDAMHLVRNIIEFCKILKWFLDEVICVLHKY